MYAFRGTTHVPQMDMKISQGQDEKKSNKKGLAE
jgi:hypothetical protein